MQKKELTFGNPQLANSFRLFSMSFDVSTTVQLRIEPDETKSAFYVFKLCMPK